jgi:hypothetical protein
MSWETPTLLGPLGRANPSRWTVIDKRPVSETLCSLEHRTVNKVPKKPVIQYVTLFSVPLERVLVKFDVRKFYKNLLKRISFG